MKLLIASDIHGDLYAAQQLSDKMRTDGYDKLILLGDLLYHGPRNALPPTYDPSTVITCLNTWADHILAVRGNCDTEVDQMVLRFPILAEYAVLYLDGLTLYLTHGHRELPPLCASDILLQGHTHIDTDGEADTSPVTLNPGSVSIPKGKNGPTYMTYEGRVFRWYSLSDGRLIRQRSF